MKLPIGLAAAALLHRKGGVCAAAAAGCQGCRDTRNAYESRWSGQPRRQALR